MDRRAGEPEAQHVSMSKGTGALDALLRHAVDYAGLFPPAALAMSDAVRAYAMYREGPRAALLGRFVVTASRLGEFADAAGPLLERGDPWPLSVLATPADRMALDTFESAMAGRAVIEAVEGTAASADDVAAYVSPRRTFVEIPLDPDPAPLLDAIARHGLCAKARTGGIAVDAFPTAAQVARFIAACAQREVPFKATAGLHHPLCGEYALTYAHESPFATMFGFLNLCVASVLARGGMPESDLAVVLEERAASAFQFDDDGITWRGRWTAAPAVRAARERLVTSFGSCSFAEPVDDLTTLRLL